MDDLFEAVTYRLGTMYEADYMKKELYEKLHDLIKDKRLVTRPIGGGLRVSATCFRCRERSRSKSRSKRRASQPLDPPRPPPRASWTTTPPNSRGCTHQESRNPPAPSTPAGIPVPPLSVPPQPMPAQPVPPPCTGFLPAEQ
ncbi:hypothetical protein V8E54_008128 [Elaphomyces granulatus]